MATTKKATKVSVTFVFGRRSYEFEGYGSDGGSPTDPFIFTFFVEGFPSSWHSVYALLGFFRKDFILACKAARTQSVMDPQRFDLAIPTGYLNRPTIEVNGTELLMDGEKPNPWLSRI